jgi:hypothetical protein
MSPLNWNGTLSPYEDGDDESERVSTGGNREIPGLPRQQLPWDVGLRDVHPTHRQRKAISLDPFFAQPHLVLANVYERLGKYGEATVEHLESDALEGVDPTLPASNARI